MDSKLRVDLYLYFYLYLCLCVSVVFLADSVHSAGGLWVNSSKWNCLICKYLYLLVYLYLYFLYLCFCCISCRVCAPWVDSSNWNCLICKRLTRKCAANRWIPRSKIPLDFLPPRISENELPWTSIAMTKTLKTRDV